MQRHVGRSTITAIAIGLASGAGLPMRSLADSPAPVGDPTSRAFQFKSFAAPVDRPKPEAASKPDYRFGAVPFNLSSWDSNDWAIEVKASGLVRAEGRRLILTFGDPVLIRRSNPRQRNPPSVITNIQVLLVVENRTIARSEKVTIATALPPGREVLEIEMPEEMAIELDEEPRGRLSPGLANANLRLSVSLPGRDDKGVERPEWGYCYAEGPRTLFADMLVAGGHKSVCARADTLRRALDWDCPERVQQLVAAGANPRALDPTPRSEERDTPLEEAVRKNDLKSALALLAAGADPNLRADVYTPFELAAYQGQTELIEPMLKVGAVRDAVGPHGFTPLMLAANFNHPATVTALLRAGADPNQRATNKTDPFWEGQTALMYAMRAEQAEVRHVLLDAGADPTRSMANGFTAFLLAAQQAGLNAFREFLERGVPVNKPGDRGLFEGITPFMSAAVGSDVKNMEALITLGADPRLRDKKGHDALYWARQFKRAGNAAWLERYRGG
jgi:ankyrin repeat protein